MKRLLTRGISCLVALSFVSTFAIAQMSDMKSSAGPVRAIAVLHPTKGSTASGIVRFEVVSNGVKVVADLAGLTPGAHGFHIHEFGDCSSDDGLSAGGHFNPGSMPHSMPAAQQRHVGDMGNVIADSSGNAHLEYVDPVIALSGNNSVIGRGVIVHEKADDLKTQPTGAAGGRVVCGAIGITK